MGAEAGSGETKLRGARQLQPEPGQKSLPLLGFLQCTAGVMHANKGS